MIVRTSIGERVVPGGVIHVGKPRPRPFFSKALTISRKRAGEKRHGRRDDEERALASASASRPDAVAPRGGTGAVERQWSSTADRCLPKIPGKFVAPVTQVFDPELTRVWAERIVAQLAAEAFRHLVAGQVSDVAQHVARRSDPAPASTLCSWWPPRKSDR